MKEVFSSDSILYVEVNEQLVPDYLAMVNDIEHVGRLMGRTETISAEKERKWVRKKLAEKAPVFSMLEKKTGAFIGNIELMDIKDSVGELGIGVTAAMQDRGYGTEAVQAATEYAREHLGLSRVFLKVFPENARAIHVYEKCGFSAYGRNDRVIFMEKSFSKTL